MSVAHQWQEPVPMQLGRDAVNHELFRRQHLAWGSHASVDTVMRDLIGLHATDPASPYLQLFARVDRFEMRTLDRLLERGRAAKVAGMRGTLFVQSADLIPLVLAATRRVLVRGRDRYLADNGLTPRRYRQLATRVRDALAGQALDAREIRDALGTREALPAVLHLMGDDAPIVRWKGRDGWRDSKHTYRLFEEALPRVDLTTWDEADAVRELVRRYLVTYGPVSERDIAWWTGFDKSTVRDQLAALGSEVVETEIDDVPGRFLVQRAGMGSATRSNERSGVALVPLLDPYVQGYRDRARYVKQSYRDFVFDRKGNSMPTVLLDGEVVGVWDLATNPRKEALIHFLAPLTKAVRRSVLARAKETASFLLGESLPIVEVPSMTALTERAGWITSPLQKSRPVKRRAGDGV